MKLSEGCGRSPGWSLSVPGVLARGEVLLIPGRVLEIVMAAAVGLGGFHELPLARHNATRRRPPRSGYLTEGRSCERHYEGESA
jgi:hypothetical protein